MFTNLKQTVCTHESETAAANDGFVCDLWAGVVPGKGNSRCATIAGLGWRWRGVDGRPTPGAW